MEEKEFIVIKQDRSITIPESLRKLGVKRDHNVNTLTFNCLRFWNGHDLTDLTIYINYQRSDGEKGSSIAENVRVDEEDANIIYFDWTIKGHVTKIAGNVTISVCAKETDEEGIEIIHWNTEGNKTTYISDGLECNEEISEQYPDVINQIQDNIDALGDVVGALPQWSQEEAPDKTLTQEGQAADAKAVGDELEKKADKDNPVFTGSISMGRKDESTVGANSVALGAHVEASGKYSNAEGYRTEASGNQSHAEGHTTVAASTCQHVQGRYNIADNLNKYAHIIGNGTNTARSNAHTVDWKGNGWYAGKLTQEGVPTNDKDLATKKYVDDVSNEKLTKPATASVGQIFRVQSINEDGTFILEAVDMPSGSGAVDDVLIDGKSIVNENRLAMITPANLYYTVKRAMCDYEGAGWTDSEKEGAWYRLTNIKIIMDEVAVAGAKYFLGEKTEVTVVLPYMAKTGQEIGVAWYNGTTPAELSITGDILDFDFVPTANSWSEISCLYNGGYWSVIGMNQSLPTEEVASNE